MSKTTNQNTVTLSTSIKFDGKDISEITLKKPNAGALRGLKLSEVLLMDVNALIQLLPRITQPPLSPQQLSELDPADFTAMAVKTTVFFAQKKQLEELSLEMSSV